MNGRVHHDETPEGRVAAVCRSLAIQMEKKFERQPDYADFRDAIRPFIQRELLVARIEEARKLGSRTITERVRDLAQQLINLKMPDEFDL